jgi:D-sedoheptulose 7-phosphate isomerase
MIKAQGKKYISDLRDAFDYIDWLSVDKLYDDIKNCWVNKRNVFFCGNGGSAGNAMHIVNDFLYGIAKSHGKGLSAIALSANPSILTCLANDIGYENIFSEQLAVHARKDDVLVVLSGSGNSSNIINVLKTAKLKKIKSHAIVAFDGGESKNLADNSIHLKINDMQIAEDSQLIICHIIMQRLYQERRLEHER